MCTAVHMYTCLTISWAVEGTSEVGDVQQRVEFLGLAGVEDEALDAHGAADGLQAPVLRQPLLQDKHLMFTLLNH